jgi:hypothetical protein
MIDRKPSENGSNPGREREEAVLRGVSGWLEPSEPWLARRNGISSAFRSRHMGNVRLWEQDRTEEALDAAKFAAARIPRSADLKCLLGRAFLRLTPPRLQEAEIALREADRLGCKRRELIPLWLEARSLMRDWVGVIELTHLAEKREGHKSEYTMIRSQANLAIAEMELEKGNLANSAKVLLETGLDIDQAFAQGFARGNVYELKEMRFGCLNKYVGILDRINDRPRDGLSVWLGCVMAFKAYVRNEFVIRTGINRLRRWWEEVRRDDRFDQKALNAAERAREELEMMFDVMSAAEPPDKDVIDKVRAMQGWLAEEVEEYLHASK